MHLFQADRFPEFEALAQRHQVLVEGGSVVWRTLGRGRPLVLLHGGHGNWLHWARNLKALSASRQLWIPDMPGYGDSEVPAQATLSALVLRLNQSLDTLIDANRPVDLIGFSFGALVAVHLAVMREVHCLALLGPAGHGTARRPRSELVSWRAAAEAGDWPQLQSIMQHNLHAHMLYHPQSTDSLAVRIHIAACLGTRFHSRTISRAGGLRELLPDVATHHLLVWGEHDVTADPIPLAQSLASSLPSARSVVVPDAGHWVQFEAAEVVNQLLCDWLAEYPHL